MKAPTAALLLALPLALPLVLAACDRAPPPVQRVDLAEAEAAMPRVMEQSPDTSQAFWQVADNGQAVHFGNAGAPPLLSLVCRPTENPPELSVIRHLSALPGQGALFPVIGNGMRSRFLVDATLADGEWRWEAQLMAADPSLDVFTGPREMTATLPGGGMLEIGGSRIPGEFITWCRAGGVVRPTGADETPEDETPDQPVS